MKFRLSKYFSVNPFASPDVFIFKTSYKKSGGTAKPVGFRMSAEVKKMATEFTTMYRQNSQTIT